METLPTESRPTLLPAGCLLGIEEPDTGALLERARAVARRRLLHAEIAALKPSLVTFQVFFFGPPAFL